MNGNDTFLDVNNAHLRVTSGNVYASAFNLDQIDIVMSSNTASTVNFNNPTKAFNAASNIEVGTANLFVDTTTTRVGVGTASPATTLDVAGDLNVSGNLTIIGTRTTLDTEHLMVKDPIIELGKGNAASPVVDLGLILTRPATTSNVGIIFDESESTLEIGYTQGNASDSTITMQTADTEPLSVNVNGSLSAAKDQDVTSYLGRAAIGYNGQASDTASFAHIDHNSNAGFAIRQNSSGGTRVNSKSGQPISFRINNSEKMSLENTGDFVVDTDTLYVDAVNDRVGIGTTTPTAKLHIKSSSGVDGIAIVNPAGGTGGLLNSSAGVRGGILISNSGGGSDAADDYSSQPIVFSGGGTGATNGNIRGGSIWSIWGGSEYGLAFKGASDGDSVPEGGTTPNMFISSDKIGIGTTSPATKLHVEHYGSAIGDFEGIRIANHASLLHATVRPAYEFVVSDINAGTGIGNGKFAIGYRATTSASRTDRLVIDNSGNVGIGTTTPRTNLHIGQQLSPSNGNTIPTANIGASTAFPSSTHAWFAHRTNTTSEEYWGLAVGTIYDGASYLQNLNKQVANKYYNLLLQPNGGNVGIGTTSPNWPLEVSGGNNSITHYGPNTTWGGRLAVGAANDKTAASDAATAQCIVTNGNLHLDAADTRSLYLNHYRGATVYYQSTVIHGSDDRLKSEEELITNATDTLLKLSPQKYKKAYTLREDESREPFIESGLMAQDVWYDAPELRHLVHLGADATPVEIKPDAPVDGDIQQDPDYSSWGTETAALNYDGLIAYLIKSNQELHARIQALENA